MTKVVGLDGEETCYSYDAAGRRTETTSGTLTTAYSYDDIGNLLAQVTTGEREIAYRYSYNRNGNITGEVRTEGDTTTESTYAYDALGQLTSFMQSTGYGESYTYDRVGNMTKKVISGMDGEKVALSMAYNKGNQMVSMANGRDKIAYTYDKNGSMVKKALTSQTYGKLTDSYSYNSLDQLTSYTGYDGYQQQFTYDVNGVRLSKSEKGNASRSTLEELLRGNVAGLPEVIAPTETEKDYSWATTEYLYDLTQEYYQVIQKNTANETTVYEYGLERIAEYTNDAKHSYVYDGRGSVVLGAGYTPFGEQMGVAKVSGYSYNAEDYDAATGMLNLRARQYEPAMNRFSQKDVYQSMVRLSPENNRYSFCMNNPNDYVDPTGKIVRELTRKAVNAENKNVDKLQGKISTINDANKAKKQPTDIWESIKYLGSGFVQFITQPFVSQYQRAETMIADPSAKNIINTITFGMSGNIENYFKENLRRGNEAQIQPSFYSVVNWVTSGALDTVQEAFTVDPQNPANQWNASLRVGVGVFGIYTLAGGCSVINPSSLGQSLGRDLPTYGYNRAPSEEMGVGNPVRIEGRGNTGRTVPMTLQEQMAMEQVKSNPLFGATELPIILHDTRWPAAEGWVKMQNVVILSDGTKITIHFVYNKELSLFDDFKFK